MPSSRERGPGTPHLAREVARRAQTDALCLSRPFQVPPDAPRAAPPALLRQEQPEREHRVSPASALCIRRSAAW